MHPRLHGLPPLLALLLLAGCAGGPGPAAGPMAPEPASSQPHEAVVDSLMAEWSGDDSPGAVVGVVRDGGVVFAKGYGMANLTHDVPITAETRFNTGSVAKQFTGFALALLESRGALSLDDPARTYLPELPEFEEEVTLRHLLTHTSGYRETYGMGSLAGLTPGESRYPREGALEVVRRQTELEYPVGSKWQYNSSAYVLLAMVVERVTGEPFPAWMKANLFDPLGMDRTLVEPDVEAVIPGAADSYVRGPDGDWLTAFSNRAYWGAGDMYTTVADLAKWFENLDTAELGGPEVRDRLLDRFVLTSGDTLTYALGVNVDEHRGLRRIQHGGAHAGYRTFVEYFPALDAGVVFMSNTPGVGDGVVAEVEELFFGDRLEPAGEEAPPAEVATGEEAEAHAVAPELLERYAGDYRIENGPPMWFRVEDGVLTGRLADQPWFPMRPVSDTEFVVDVPEIDARIEFRTGPAGVVEGATLYQAGRTASIVPTGTWQPGPDALAAFAGRYLSPEIETIYTLVVDDDRLVARHRWNPDLVLEPLEEDVFVGAQAPYRVVFERDDSGEVTGLRVSAGRTTGVWFEKWE